MAGDRCVVCGNSKAKDPNISMHRFPAGEMKRKRWIEIMGLAEGKVKQHSRICSRHFRNGDPANGPEKTLGKKFASPKKLWSRRAERAQQRDVIRSLTDRLSSPAHRLTPSSSKSPTPTPTMNLTSSFSQSPPCSSDNNSLVHSESEVFESDAQDQASTLESTSTDTSSLQSRSGRAMHGGYQNSEVVVNTALLVRIEMLESENQLLKKKVESLESRRKAFRIEDISNDDSLTKLYTGFVSFGVLKCFYEFLGPAVNELSYWGERKNTAHKRRRPTKLDPMNQFFLTLVKLKLNPQVRDLAYRFCISKSLVSKYVITWINFLYHHLCEVNWMPTVEQVTGTLPHSFREKYSSTFAIIDGSEIFIETPSDLQVQSSTWSNYKHHNTSKFLIACTPNGAISFISHLYVGSISDVELTRVSGFIEELKGKSGISVMADRGFTIKDQLAKIGVDLNIPPFMDGREQLPAEEVSQGRSIASLRIHVERAIGRMKTFSILKGTLPNTLARIANHIVSVCAWLTNFHLPLVPPPQFADEADVEKYFISLDETDHDADSSSDDNEYY